jgi:hypothetical protein
VPLKIETLALFMATLFFGYYIVRWFLNFYNGNITFYYADIFLVWMSFFFIALALKESGKLKIEKKSEIKSTKNQPHQKTKECYDE